jgi:hypothetical protein
MNPVPDPLLLRKCGSARNRTRDLWICSQELWQLDHRYTFCDPLKIYFFFETKLGPDVQQWQGRVNTRSTVVVSGREYSGRCSSRRHSLLQSHSLHVGTFVDWVLSMAVSCDAIWWTRLAFREAQTLCNICPQKHVAIIWPALNL